MLKLHQPNTELGFEFTLQILSRFSCELSFQSGYLFLRSLNHHCTLSDKFNTKQTYLVSPPKPAQVETRQANGEQSK